MSESPPRWVESQRDGDARLALDFLPASTPNAPLWIFLHGLNSHRRGEKALHFARQIVRRGDAFASLDLTGHGDSEGDLLGLSLSRNLRDLDRGVRHLERKNGPFQTIYLVGSSMGALTALWYSVQHPETPSRNVAIAPAFEMAGRLLLALGRDKARRWRQDGKTEIKTGHDEFELAYEFVEDESRYPIVSLMRRLSVPTLIIHGSDDEVVPCQLSRQFSERTKGVHLEVIEGGDHRLGDHKEELFELIWKFRDDPRE